MQVQDVNRLLKQHQGMQKMMKQLGGGKLAADDGAPWRANWAAAAHLLQTVDLRRIRALFRTP